MAFHIENEADDEGTVLSEINVTPLVDVMLVLLVIFMVTAPLINPQGVPVELPKASGQAIQEPSGAMWVTINRDGVVHVDNRAFSQQELEEKLSSVIEARNPKDVFIRADDKVPYGRVAWTMARIQAAGVQRVGLVTKPDDAASARR